jgi:hypothetical protein
VQHIWENATDSHNILFRTNRRDIEILKEQSKDGYQVHTGFSIISEGKNIGVACACVYTCGEESGELEIK